MDYTEFCSEVNKHYDNILSELVGEPDLHKSKDDNSVEWTISSFLAEISDFVDFFKRRSGSGTFEWSGSIEGETVDLSLTVEIEKSAWCVFIMNGYKMTMYVRFMDNLHTALYELWLRLRKPREGCNIKQIQTEDQRSMLSSLVARWFFRQKSPVAKTMKKQKGYISVIAEQRQVKVIIYVIRTDNLVVIENSCFNETWEQILNLIG